MTLSILYSSSLQERPIRLIPPSYSIAFYNDKTTFKNTNKLFAEFPADSFAAIRQAQVVRIRFTYEDGTSIELPLNEHDLQYDMDLETTREFVSDIGNEAERLNRMTEKLLSLTRA